MLNFLSDNLVIAVLLLVTLLVLVLLAVVISAALRSGSQGADGKGAGKLRLLGSESLRRSFRSAIELIEANLAERAERYNLSWTLLLNESTGRAVSLAQSGLPSALSTDSSLTAAAQGITWNFFDKGVVVQLQSDYLGSPDPDSAASSGIWDDFLGLCRAYRPQRPFDGIVLAIPCTALLASDPQGQLELVARAKAIHRRLWLAQNRLALRFPIHLVVTECEVLPGFSTFGAALPEPMRRSILGWASPYELAAPFRVQWVDAAMDQIVGAVADSCAELCALEQADADSRAYFLLPSEVERLRAGLHVFCEELMRPSAYHEPFLLRGIYLTGDCSDAAALLAATASLAPQPALADETEHTQLALACAQDEAALAPQDGMPVFLRDIFERKIFAEVGLVQASSQRMRRPAVNRLAYWSALLLPVLWALGLLVSSFQLHRLAGEMVVYLEALNGDARASLQSGRAAAGWVATGAAAGNGQRSQQRAVDALLNIEQLGEAHFSSVFMPGSWAIFDDLHDRVQQRLEQGFADNAFEALRRAAFAQLGRLTGVPHDPATGSLIAGAQCTLPARWHELAGVAAPNALNLEDMPQYQAMLQYLARMDELDRVTSAMLRLKGPSSVPASGDDLALVVRVLLGTELNGTPARTAALFRAVAQSVPSLAIEPMQEAARCSLHLASGALYRRLFEDNGLLRAEQAVAASTGALLDGGPRGGDLDGQLRLWQTLRAALDAQQGQLMAGKGAWMHQSSMNLGAAHEAMLERIGANSLLGKAAQDDSKQLATQGFGRFIMAWDTTLAAPNPLDAGGPGLVWSGAGTAASWSFTPERKVLHEAVAAMLAPPYMRAEAPVRLPDVPSGATIRWDKGQLERAASLAEARKAFLAGPYTRLPGRLQQPASTLVDLALAGSVHGALAQALSFSAAELPSAASDGDYASVLRVRARLEDMGARQAVAELDTALARDAMSRLRRMDEVFTAAEVFVPRDRGFQGWKGEKGALVEAFAAGDAAGLNAYLAQQQEFIDVLGKQVEGVLAQLSGPAAGQPLVARWQAILADLRRYRLKSPGSSLLAVEQFILHGSADIDLGNCADKLGARMAQRRGSDVFAERLQGLQSGLLARCRELSASLYQGEWERFAEVYNRDLGRRLPFAALSGAPAGRMRAGDAVPADREEVGAVMKLYDRASAASAQAEREPGRAAVSAAVRKANVQLRRVRDVLAPLYPAEEGQAGGLDVTAQFRANPGAEAEGNKIIEWNLSIGGASVRQNEPARAMRWEPGMPVLLSMRLARDGTATPKAEPGQPHMTVAERTVSYRFDDPWALFSFIGAFREDEAPGSEGRAPLLRFEFPLANTDATGKVPAADSRARVFLRLAVSAPGKRTPLAWPAVFPAQAPAWQEAALPAAGSTPERFSMQADRSER